MPPENNGPRTLAENLYKQGAELAGKNKTLALLNKLYEISVLALNPKEIAARVSQTIQIDLAFELVGIFLCDQSKKELQPLAFVSSERLQTIQSNRNLLFENLTVPIFPDSFLDGIVQNKEVGYTEALADIWDDLLSPEVIIEMQSSGHVKSSFAYPLVSRDTVIGIFIFSLNRTRDQLLDYEHESIGSFVNVVAVAIDKALLSEELREANEQQTSLIHFITHQVKGFLTKSRYIFGELDAGTYGALESKVAEVVKQGFRFNTDGVSMVQNVLHAANIKTGKVTYEKLPLDFKKLVEGEVEKQQKVAEEKGVALVSRTEAGEYAMEGDADQLSHAVQNLIDNAIKYTPKGKVTVSLERKGGMIRLSVKDSGIGISEKDKEHIFTEGGRGEESQKVNPDSTGYGLYIVKGIVEAHGGTVWFLSNGPGTGTTFFVEMPVS